MVELALDPPGDCLRVHRDATAHRSIAGRGEHQLAHRATHGSE
jgi:hypothetical protein